MARHRAPRSPIFTLRRLTVLGALGVSGAVALGVLVSPNSAADRIDAAPIPSPKVSPTPVPRGPSSVDELPRALADQSVRFVEARAVRQAEEAARKAEEERLAEEAARREAEEAARREAEEQARREAEQAAERARQEQQAQEAAEAERARQRPAEEPPAPAAAAQAAPAPPVNDSLTGKPTPSSSSYSLWAPHVRPVVADVVARFGIGTVYTRPGHSPTQQLAADFMTTDKAKGDAVAAYLLSLPGVEYVIWQRRYNDGSGWSFMEDRGSVTANHYDHVHASFRP